MSDGLLFDAPIQSRETDERYTPSWIFDALGETFDLDPASPPLGVSRVPTAAVWTKDDDGLTQPWHGFVWCNPPFSHSTAWADRFIAHGDGIWLGPVANGHWHDRMTRASDAMVLLRDFAFIAPDHAGKRSSMPLSLHGFGHRALVALQRFSSVAPTAGVLMTRTPNPHPTSERNEDMNETEALQGGWWSHREWEEWSNTLARLILDGDESTYSNPEGAQEGIIEDCFAAYVRERADLTARLARVEALADEMGCSRLHTQTDIDAGQHNVWCNGATWSRATIEEALLAALVAPSPVSDDRDNGKDRR